MGPPSPPPTDTSHSPCPEMQLPPGKQVLGQQLGRVGSLSWVGEEGQDRKLEKTLALGHILKPLSSNGKLRSGVWGQRKINLGHQRRKLGQKKERD